MTKLHWCLATLLCVPVAVPADELRTLSGKTVTGALSSADDKEIVLDTKDGPVATALAQVLAVDVQPVRGVPPGVKLIALRLVDDTTLSCKDVQFQGNTATLTLTSGVRLKLPVATIVSLVRDADNQELRKKFDEFAAQRVRLDRIVILRDGLLNPLEGSLGDIDPEGKKIRFQREGLEVPPIPIERLHGIIFYRPDPAGDTPICRVHDTAGNVLTVSRLLLKDKTWELTTTFGTKVPLPSEAVAKLDFNLGKLTYLSDLEPAKVIERSAIGLIVRYRKDLNLDGEPILLDRRYTKGLSMHAHTELEYDLGGKFKDLKGLLGIDVRTGSESQPLVSIYCDGEKRFSEVITPQTPRQVSLNVKDVTTLRIVVGSRNELDLHDHVSFGDARVSQ